MNELKSLSRIELEVAYGVLDKLYANCETTLKLIPPCPAHGAMCHSYYREFLTFNANVVVKEIRNKLRKQDKKLEAIRELVQT